MTRDEYYAKAIAAANGNEEILAWIKLQYATCCGGDDLIGEYWYQYFCREWQIEGDVPHEEKIEEEETSSKTTD